MTRVHIYGRNFEDSSGLNCFFNNQTALGVTFVSSQEIICTSPSFSQPMDSCTVEVTVNGIDFTRDGIPYYFLPEVRLSSLRPTIGEVAGGTNIVITGSNFMETASLSCLFGNRTLTKARWISDETIECPAPKSEDVGAVNITVTLNGQDFSGEFVEYTYISPLHVIGFEPHLATTLGTTVLTISGTDFFDTPMLAFRIGSSLGRANYLNSSTIDFVIPPFQPGQYSVAVSNNGQNFYVLPRNLTIFPIFQLEAVSPLRGGLAGGTPILITGSAFVNASSLACVFTGSSYSSPATYMSSTEIRCVTPPATSPGFSLLRVAINGADDTQIAVSFEYMEEALFWNVFPPSGPSDGGTRATISGSGFMDRAGSVCRFGDTTTSAEIISSSKMECLAPPVKMEDANKTISLQFSYNGIEYSDSAVNFLYYRQLMITRITPTTGPLEGGTVVDVFGSDFIESSLLMCRFGLLATAPASFINASYIQCISPPSQPGQVTISVANNGIDFGPALEGASFSYTPRPVISNIQPQLGSTRGNTSVEMTGDGFLYGPHFACLFNQTAALSFEILSPHKVVCVSPPFPKVGKVQVSISSNGQELSSGQYFKYVEDAYIWSIEPDSGPLSGGTDVTLSGMNFVPSPELLCDFGGIKTRGRYISSTEISCITPPFANASSVGVFISLNGVEDVEGAATFTYYEAPVVIRIDPFEIPLTGAFSVTIDGEGFRHSPGLLCRFNDTEVKAYYIGPTRVLCKVPPLPRGSLTVTCSNNGRDFSTPSMESADAVVIDPAVISGMYPTLGYLSGGTSVIIEGSGFPNVSDIVCSFGGIQSRSTAFVSPNAISCVAPPSSQVGPVPVEVTSNKVPLISGDLQFFYARTPLVFTISPGSGPIRGGTPVQLEGFGFMNIGNLTCRFGSNEAPARWLSSSQLECVTPGQDEEGLVLVSVSLNGQDFSITSREFVYYMEPQVKSFFPEIGLISGGTILTVYGSGFVNGDALRCVFTGGKVSKAIYLNSTALRCLTPSLPPGDSAVAISSNGIDVTYSESVFSVIPAARVDTIHPKAGSRLGGTKVRITGIGFSKHDSLTCLFGQVSSQSGVILSDSELECIAPESLDKGEVVIRLQTEGGILSTIEDAVTFEYQDQVFIWSIQPRSGSMAGNTVVLLEGTNFVASEDLFCRFGGALAPARWISDRRLECVAPPSNGSQVVEVAVTQNGIDFIAGHLPLSYEYEEDLQINVFFPSEGSSSGKTVITILGENFVFSSAIRCRLGILDVPATFLNQSAIQCITPPSDVGTVEVAVTNNGQDYVVADDPFSFFPDLLIHGVEPKEAVAGGGTLVSVSGENFASSATLTCYFGEVTATETVFVSSSLIRCRAPPLVGLSMQQLSRTRLQVLIRVSQNGKDLSTSSAVFSYQLDPVLLRLDPHLGPVAGGTRLRVHGYGFPHSGNLTCLFGDYAVPARLFSSFLLECTSPEAIKEGNTSLKISLDGRQGFMGNSLDFLYYQPPVVSAVFPTSALPGIESWITVQAQNVINSSLLSCQFGAREFVSAYTTDIDEVVCLLPNTTSSQAGVIQVRLSNNGVDSSESYANLTFVAVESISFVNPKYGSMSGGLGVEIHGTNFENRSELSCYFGGLKSPETTFVSSSMIRCVTPPQNRSGNALVQISSDASDVLSSMVYFEYLRGLFITAIIPPSGSVAGGTQIVVHGYDFRDTDTLICRFGNAISSARFLSRVEVECITPSMLNPGIVNVTVSVNGVDFSSNLMAFQYYESVAVSSVGPLHGPSSGGTKVRILGKGFQGPTGLQCTFGGQSSVAILLSDSEMFCPSPPSINQQVILTIATSTGELISSPLVFAYENLPSTVGLSPIFGQLEGGTPITISFTGPVQVHNKTLYCRFGMLPEVPLVLRNGSSHGICITPASASLGLVPVKVFVLEDSRLESPNILSFEYRRAPIITRVAPLKVFHSQPTIIAVIGGWFHNSPALVCRFSSNNSAVALSTGEYNSPNHFTCLSPSLPPAIYDLAISNNGIDFHPTGFTVGLYVSVTISHASPESMYTTGGQMVYLMGTGFRKDLDLQCSIGDQLIDAVYVNNSAIYCVPGSQSLGTVPIRVCLAHVCSQSSVNFSFIASIEVVSITPAVGSVNGNTTVKVLCKNLVGSEAYCSFGGHVSKGQSLDASSMACFSPPKASLPNNVELRVSSNGVDFSSEKIIFTYFKPVVITKCSPTVVSELGGVTLRVKGSTFLNTPGLGCHFFNPALGEAFIISAASWISVSEIQCATPALKPGDYDLAIGYENYVGERSSQSCSVTVRQVFTISSISPSRGLMLSPTLVKVYGTNFYEDAGLRCRFGKQLSYALFVNTSLLVCEAPAVEQAGVVDFKLVLAGEGATANILTYEYVDQVIEIEDVSPKMVDSSGSVRITISGKELSGPLVEPLFVKMCQQVIPVTISTNTSVSFMAPPSSRVGWLPFTVSFGQNQTFEHPLFSLRYHRPIIVTECKPTAGWTTGGTTVKCYGNNFIGSSAFSCKFGEVYTTSAAVVSDRVAVCIAPPQSPGQVVIQISNNNDTFKNTTRSYNYHLPASVTSISPSHGFEKGKTKVLISGARFTSAPMLRCYFNDSYSFAEVINSTCLACLTPAHLAGMTIVRVAVNDQDFSASDAPLTFEYRSSSPSLKSIFPSKGPSTARNITVLGEGFDLDGMFCGFYYDNKVWRVSPALWVEETKLSCALSGTTKDTSYVFVSVSSNAYDFSNAMKYTFYPTPKLLGISPNCGPSGESTTLKVAGYHFVEDSMILCRFGLDNVVEGRFLSPSTAECTTPQIPPGRYHVSLSFNGVDFTTEDFIYESYLEISILGIVPTFAPVGIKTMVAITGKGFRYSPQMACQVGDGIFKAVYVNASRIYCGVEILKEGLHPVSVTLNGLNYAGSDLSFRSLPEPKVGEFFPHYGSTSGGTIVVIKGEGLSVINTCWFGEMGVPVQAMSIDHTNLTCISPAAPKAQGVSLKIGVNGTVLAYMGDYTFTEALYIHRVTPSHVVTAGGQMVAVEGLGFVNSESLCCRIGGSIRSGAIWNSRTLVHCSTPASAPMETTVEVSNNCQDFDGASLPLTYYIMPTLRAIHPQRGPAGGGTLLLIEGSNFYSSGELSCRFGKVFTPASYMNESMILCRTPYMPKGGPVEVRISYDGIGSGTTNDSLTFNLLYGAPMMASIDHSLGPGSGGGPVLVLGENFLADNPGMFCRFSFGNRSATIIQAIDVTPSSLKCPLPHVEGAQSATIELSQNGFDFNSNRLRFRFYGTVSLWSISPGLGPSEGGSRVRVCGYNFIESAGIRCKFGRNEEASIVLGSPISSDCIECVTPKHSPGSLPVGLSFNDGKDFHWRAGLNFEFHAPMAVFNATPSFGSVLGGTAVYLASQNVVFSSNLSCRFGDYNIVKASIYGDRVVCVSPLFSSSPADTGTVSLEVSGNGVDFSRNQLKFTYIPEPEVYEIHPTFGPTKGQNEVVIKGDRFVNKRGTLKCRFGEKIVDAVFVSPNELTCTAPTAPKGKVLVSITVNGVDFTETSLPEYEYGIYSYVQSVAPRHGAYNSSTEVTVYGGGFVSSIDLTCRFQDLLKLLPPLDVPAVYIRKNELKCTAPTSLPGVVTIEVSNNRKDFTSNGWTFEYYDQVSVNSVHPATGPIQGGTPVYVVGKNFVLNPVISCRFGTIDSLASFISKNQLKCVAPPQTAAATVPLKVTFNGLDFITAGDFTYAASPSVYTVEPDILFVGLNRSILLSGEGFADTSYLSCKFTGRLSSEWRESSYITAARLMESSKVQCNTPLAMISDQFITVEVSNNGFDYSRNGVSYKVIGGASFSSVTPRYGPETGGTLVKIVGFNLPNTEELSCRFGNVTSDFVQWKSRSELWCRAPSNAPGSQTFSITVNGFDYVENQRISYTYYEQIGVSGIDPAIGSASGDTLVSIWGTNFKPSRNLRCRFGNEPVRASYINSTLIKCVTPPQSPGTALVGVSINAQDFVEADVQFTFIPTMQIYAMRPRRGPSRGGTLVTLEGEGFKNTSGLSCRFGGVPSEKVNWVSSQAMTCVVPPRIDNATSKRSVLVEISMNGIDFTSGDVVSIFEYYRAPIISSIAPVSVPENTPSSIMVYGTGFINSIGLMCRFGNQPASKARWLSGSALVCQTSNLTLPMRSAPLYISNNGLDFEDTKLFVRVDARNYTLAFAPVKGPDVGGTLVSIAVPSPLALEGYRYCKFDLEIVNAMVDPIKRVLMCRSPPRRIGPGLVSLKVSHDSINFYGAEMPFEYMATPTIYNITPSSGPQTGGTPVMVLGSDFQTSNMFCRFKFDDDSQIVRARALSSSQLVCSSPNQRMSGLAIVDVSINGVDFTSTNTRFRYYSPVRLFSALPHRGPEGGGTRITVFGFGFVDSLELTCHFGMGGIEVKTPGFYNSSQVIFCTSPAHMPGTVNIGVSFNGVDVHEDEATFIYDFAIKPGSLSPHMGSTGGRTLVTIDGVYFEYAKNLKCRFGLRETSALYVNTRQIKCYTPASSEGTVDVGLSLNGIDYAYNNLSFTYVTPPSLSSLSPAYGWMNSFTTVNLIGFDFLPELPIFCRLANFLTVPATVLSPTMAQCVIPPYNPLVSPNATLKVSVGLNDTLALAGEGGISFRYLPSVDVYGVIPSFGPDNGGSILQVYGTNFPNTLDINCTFSSNHSVQTSPAYFISSELIQCAAPPHSIGEVLVSVIMLGLTVPANTARFTYIPQVEVYEVFPDFGVRDGGTNVVIKGNHFPKSTLLSCRFGDSDAVPATWLSNSEISCITPLHTEGVVALQVSTNGLDYSLATLAFRFYVPPSVSFIRPNSGPLNGGTQIQIIGKDFMNSTLLTCSFGLGSVVPAIYSSETLLTCISPPRRDFSGAVVSVTLSYNAEEFLSTGQVSLESY